MARLLVSFQGAEFGFDLRGDGVRVGSGTSCGLVLKDPSVGREHLDIRRTGNVWRLVDLESASGTRVNGLYVNKHDLKPGDVVALGGARLTFQSDESPEPAPIPGAAVAAAPMAVPAPAPIPQASPWGYAATPVQASPVYSVPTQAPPPPARRSSRGSDRGRGRDRDRDDRDDDRDRQPRGQRRGGGGGGPVLVVILLLCAGGIVALLTLATSATKKVDPNIPLLAKAEPLETKGDWEALVALGSQGDPAFPDTYQKLQWASDRGKARLAVLKAASDVADADDFYKVQIKGPHDNGSMDASALVLRCDDFIRRWPTHERIDDANFIRISLTAEPSPAWIAAKGGNQPGKAFISASLLLDASEMEAKRRMDTGRFVQAYAVYEEFLKRAPSMLPPDKMDEFKATMVKKKKYVEDKAKDLYDKAEEKGMVLEDRKQYEQEEQVFREARENYALGDNVKRADAEIQRLSGMHK